MSSSSISAGELRKRIVGPHELALIDVREGGIFAKSHLLFAINCPLSRLELRIESLVPRKDVTMVLCAGAEHVGWCETAEERLKKRGYSDISILRGGIESWAEAGFELFSGVHVPSKAFGEFVETRAGTPHLSAKDVQKMRKSGDNFVILDSRPFKEYHTMNIPDGINVPGAELAYRIHDLAPDPETKVIVNCAGRTRSIIGAQSLINAGIPNFVAAIENGTMGWHLAGMKLERGQTRTFDKLSMEAHLTAMDRAIRVRERFRISEIDEQTALQWEQDTTRSTFFLDVRDPAEFAISHRPGSKNAPGGQLVQATDHYVGVRRARLVLIDDDGVRATMTASWLKQMGWHDVHIFVGADKTFRDPVTAPAHVTPEHLEGALIDVVDLKEGLDQGRLVVVDLATSIQYRDNGHIPSSWFAIRSHMPENLSQLPEGKDVVLVSPDGSYAELAYEEAQASGKNVKILSGGTQSWTDAGHDLEFGFTQMADEPVDLWYKPYEFDDDDKNIEQAMEQYLTWEVDLVGQIERDGTTEFRLFD